MSLSLCPITLSEARAFVTAYHRHHRAPQGGLFAIGCAFAPEGPEPDEAPSIAGVVIVGRPVARRLADDYTAEVTRLCTLGAHNVSSMLYQAAWRAWRAMGGRKLVTYTLKSEGGQLTCRRVDLDRRSGRRLVVTQGAPTRRHASDAAEAPLGARLMTRAYTAPKHIRRGRAGSPWSSADVIAMASNTIHHRDDWTAMKLADGGILVADSHASPCTILDAARKLWPRDVFRFELDAHAQELLDAAAQLRGAS